MELQNIITLVIGILGAIGGCSTLIVFLIKRHDERTDNSFTKEERQKILTAVSKIATLEQDTARIQLLSLIQHSPTNKDTILYQARHYFGELKGNTYMISVFVDWGKEQGIDEKVIWEIINSNGKNNEQ